MTVTYGIMALVAAILLIGYSVLIGKKEPWLLLLYICITVVNTGYFLLALSKSVGFALFANDLAYLGSVFLSTSMLLTIVRLCGFKISRKLVITLIAAGAVMFAIIATSGILPWYYREVSLEFVDGAAKLNKVYGVLHPLYMVYLAAYFAAMIACIFRSLRRRIIASQKYASLLAMIVFGNIAVWFVEKFIPWDFEFLSISYLFSEIILLGLYWMMQDYVRQDLAYAPPADTYTDVSPSLEDKLAKILAALPEGETLASREQEILELILQSKKRREIAEALCLSENTIKTYTRTLYGKLGVRSREELYALLDK
ncbi:MAG: hypothetical protein IKY46_01550 [Clostridia bacterium]|nr:hypothetical protein [Clostridia bacterium]MBR5903380.1 hypothetical protein [Clostridia bacterium]